jgi:uncharacterized protein (DUF1800 family)
MSTRPFVLACFAVLIAEFAAGGQVAYATPPVLLSAVSRMTHGAAGSFDVQLPLTGGSGIECRSTAAGLSIVITFDQPVTSGSAAITLGTGTLNGNPVFSASTMTVNLSAVANAQALNLTVTNVTNAASETLASAVVPFRTLRGDILATGLLTGSDVGICASNVGSGATVNGSNFRCDVNVDGMLSGADVGMTAASVGGGASVTGGPTANTAPTIGTVANQSAVTGQPLSPVGFTVGDAESAPTALYVWGTSSNPTLIPNSAIVIGGSGPSRTVSFTPTSPQSGTAIITLSVSDGLLITSTTFTASVIPPPTLYFATLSPIPGIGTASLGSGTATLAVSGDQTYAILSYGLSNLTSNDTDDALYSGGNTVQYDIPVGKARGDQQPNGSYKWVFSASKIPVILQSLQAGTFALIAETADNPSGELSGTFALVTGSQTFTPPSPPPSITINPPAPYDASRFLQQSQFGGNGAEIGSLSNASAANAGTAINDWLTAQFAMPLPISPNYTANVAPVSNTFSSSSMYQNIYNRVTQAQAPNAYADPYNDDRVNEAWWRNAVTAPDQLRQRVATALSEIFVISEIDSQVDDNELGVATYYDMLADDAFGNFRTLLGDVTLHPAMGEYLNMMGNNWINSSTSPNENYAREVMQLFTVGLYMLQPDGTLMLDQNGNPIPTYSQPTITQFAHVYTGWNENGTPVVVPLLPQPATGSPVVVSNLNSYWQKPMVLSPASGAYHSQLSKQLLVYPGAATFPGASQPAYIPANASQTATSATAELNFALDNIFNHPNVGPFFCKQLIQRLVESNPSPAYVYRVAQVFDNDGQGVRGDMKAVITAILTDYEARSPTVLNDVGYGHMREPIVRMADILRSLNAVSKTGKWEIGKTDATLAQTIFRSPTVFNFFSPTYSNPGPVQLAGLVSPELDIIYETTVTNSQNMLYTGIYANYNTTSGAPLLTGTGFRGDAYGSDIYLDFSTAGNGLLAYAQANGTDSLIDRVGLLLMGVTPAGGTNPMDPNMHTRIKTFLTGYLTASNYLGQAQAAVHLVGTAAQTSVQK